MNNLNAEIECKREDFKKMWPKLFHVKQKKENKNDFTFFGY